MTNEELEELRFKSAIPHLIQAGLDLSHPASIDSCPICGEQTDIRKRRLNTNYHEEELNWMVSCVECFKEVVAQYADMWAEYYNGRL